MTGQSHDDAGTPPEASSPVAFAIPDHDPLAAYLIHPGGPVDPAALDLDSPALERLRRAGIELIVPLVSHGELIGTLNLGHRLSDQSYSVEDRRLLGNLAARVAPAIRVAQLVREQQAQAQERERIEQELRVASLIQQTLLPKQLPSVAGWTIEAYYRPARAVGGDFYDFVDLSDGRLGLIIGDVTDKGVPAALVMATCRSMLRAAAPGATDPGKMLAGVNEALVDEIPDAMFVTCLYGILDPSTGALEYANAGHNVPYLKTTTGVTELRATGMPLGLMSDSRYEVKSTRIEPGDMMVLSSDGIVEAHDHARQMYGFSRLIGNIAAYSGASTLIEALVADLERFVGAVSEPEDDVTLVTVRREPREARLASTAASRTAVEPGERRLAGFSLASVEGNERKAMKLVAQAIADVGLVDEQLDRLQTAVSEATMNAIEHGNQNRADLMVDIEVLASSDTVTVRITDHGGGRAIPDPVTPDLEAKLAGEQPPRGWGLFLIEHMVDNMRTLSDDRHHTIELRVNQEARS